MPAVVAHINDIPPVDLPRAPEGHEWRPIRSTLGIQAFGVNAYVGQRVGDEVIGEHNESEPGDPQHEELYLVTHGRASFVVDGNTIDAPTGTLVFVGNTSDLRSATAAEPNTTVLAIGSKVGEPYAVSDWEAKYVGI